MQEQAQAQLQLPVVQAWAQREHTRNDAITDVQAGHQHHTQEQAQTQRQTQEQEQEQEQEEAQEEAQDVAARRIIALRAL